MFLLNYWTGGSPLQALFSIAVLRGGLAIWRTGQMPGGPAGVGAGGDFFFPLQTAVGGGGGWRRRDDKT